MTDQRTLIRKKSYHAQYILHTGHTDVMTAHIGGGSQKGEFPSEICGQSSLPVSSSEHSTVETAYNGSVGIENFHPL